MKKKLTPVIIAQKAVAPKAVALTEILRQSIESKLIQAAPSLKEKPELTQAMINTIVNMVKVYLPEYSEKEILRAGPEKLKKITNRVTEAYKHAVVDTLIFPIADELNARNIALSGDAVGKIIDNLTPNIINIQQEKDLMTILNTSKKERFSPKKYTGAKEVSLDQVDGGLPVLFLPEKTKELILRVLTHPIRSSLTEDPESALSLPSDNSNNGEMTIRDQVEILIREKGINNLSYKNVIGPLTHEIRSLRLLCFGITPEILLQTIEKQKSNGLKETDSAVKILRTLHQNLVEFEKEVGFPLKLVKDWAEVGNNISRNGQQPITVGTRKIHPAHQPEKLKTEHSRGKIRMRWIEQGVKKKILRLSAKTGEKIQVENRLTSIPARPIKAIFRRVSRPILKRIGKTTTVRAAKIAFRKAKRKVTKTIWQIGKKGLGKVAKEGVKLLTTKLAATKLGTALGSIFPGVGNAAGAALGFVVDKTIGVVKKITSKIPRFFRGLVSGGSKIGLKTIDGFGGLMQKISTGETMVDSKALKLVFLLVFMVIPILAIFGNMQISSAWIKELVETETRYTGPPGDLHRRTMASQDLKNLFSEVANQYCVPIEMLLAISQVEASGVWDYSDSEVARFSTSNWWDDAGCDLSLDVVVGGECNRGYCYNTCKVTGLCPGYSVVGPMQFEAGTWNGYKDRLEIALGHAPNRCNLRDSLFAAAMKIKANSGTSATQCANWDQNTVESAARAYCGSCGWEAECGSNPPPGCVNQHKACGANYCQAVWMLYNEYQ